MVDLWHILREESFLRTIGEHIGQVIAIDNSEAYRAKLFGPRIRLLVKDLNSLPQTIVLPRLDSDGVVEYQLEYSGLPNQCGRCRSRDHQVRHCPKKEAKLQRKEPRTTQPVTEPDPAPTPAITPPTESNEESNSPVEQHQQETQDVQNEDAHETDRLIATMDVDTSEANPTTTNSSTEERENLPPTDLQPNDTNFPQLTSPSAGNKTPHSPTTQQPGAPQAFVWRMKPPPMASSVDRGKGKATVESTPITRQGYRSGRLSDDLWEVLAIPSTPSSPRKKLRVFPFLTKNFNHAEFLSNNNKLTTNSITFVHIAEVLAGVPWTVQRARQHVVNETAQALLKVLIFSNQHNTPFQKWDQGLWFSQWTDTEDEEHLCTLYVNIAAPENKIRIRKGRNLGWKEVPKDIKEVLTNLQSFSARTTRYKGGTCIILSEQMANSIMGHGVLYPGRAQYITIRLSQNLVIGVINVYGFNLTGPRAMLWNHLAQVELPEANWILAGDFNNIEQASDKQGGSSKACISRRELEAWNRLLMRLGVRDAHHIGAFVRKLEKIFTWSSEHNDLTLIQSRIDRFYIPLHIEQIGGTIEILPTLPDISDHAGVVLHFNDEPRKRKKHPAFFNKGLLANPESRADLLTTWKKVMEDGNINTWNQKMVKANQAIITKSEKLTSTHRRNWKELYRAQFKDIIKAEAELQHNWEAREAREKLSEAHAILHEMRQQKFQFQESAILSKWARVGDRCTKEFFEHHNGTRKLAPITHMLDDEDKPISTQGELEAHILQFYRQLYTKDSQVEDNMAAREECFHYIEQSVTEEHNMELMKPLSMEEVTEAMKQLPAGKTSGVDAILAEFYQNLWEDISNDI